MKEIQYIFTNPTCIRLNHTHCSCTHTHIHPFVWLRVQHWSIKGLSLWRTSKQKHYRIFSNCCCA